MLHSALCRSLTGTFLTEVTAQYADGAVKFNPGIFVSYCSFLTLIAIEFESEPGGKLRISKRSESSIVNWRQLLSDQ